MTRIPLEPAHRPSASRDGAFSSQQLLLFLLVLLRNFLQHFAVAKELPADDGPRQASKGVCVGQGLGESQGWPRRGSTWTADGLGTEVQHRMAAPGGLGSLAEVGDATGAVG